MKTISKIILLATTMILFSCEDILEEDITNDTIQTVSPIEKDTISSNVVNFQWNIIKGATNYRVQVFNENLAVVLDSLVGNKVSLTHPFLPGTYKWRVRGENAGYQSVYSFPVGFTVVQSNDLTNQQVVLSNPISGLYTNSTSLICTWQDLIPADYYELELVNVTAGQTIILQQSNITSTSVTLNNANLAQDAEYLWKIKAVNATSQSVFSNRNFFIDRVNPNQPQNSLPANNSTQTVNQPIAFTWTMPSDAGTIQSQINYTIEFSNTTTFATILQTSTSATTMIQQSFANAGDYYWRVKAVDAASNVSTYSTAFKFTIN
ncbi:hypothetical protein EQG63_04795 [Flavobacterium amnicola]|uniref:Fibronectin type-III domain-containing protein n=1 Tax=Flavobacterium amnicola TaxID=2506422 RepID=A0A4Q1K6U8_9FLAO|nr:hypothetical protein [Flavobacterium amnicola]RXR21260.1 hypothetical protein EQG63_04795 [Flavobacterium amnicola]